MGKALICSLILAVSVTAPGAAPSAGTPGAEPAAVVERLHAGIVSEIENADPEVLAGLIMETHDFSHIARVALGRHWRGLAQDEQMRFVRVLCELSAATYATRLADTAHVRFRILDSVVDTQNRARVSAVLEAGGERDPLFEYQLHQVSGSWRIINILVDGISDLALKRAEYDRLIRERGFEGLIEELDRQAARMRERAS